MIKRYLFIFLLSIITIPALALQLVPIRNNGEAKIKISNSEFTRIFVNGDRITDVKGVQGQYHLQTDAKSGQIFIAPTKKYKNKAFNVFITTENGSIFQLMLLPKPVLSDSIELDPPMIKSRAAKKWEESTAYDAALTDLLVDMCNNKLPEGYHVSNVQSKSQWLGEIAKVTLIKIYSGDHLRGDVYRIKNVTHKTIRLDERQLYRPGARLIALKDQVIPALGSTKLFMVTNNE